MYLGDHPEDLTSNVYSPPKRSLIFVVEIQALYEKIL